MSGGREQSDSFAAGNVLDARQTEFARLPAHPAARPQKPSCTVLPSGQQLLPACSANTWHRPCQQVETPTNITADNIALASNTRQHLQKKPCIHGCVSQALDWLCETNTASQRHGSITQNIFQMQGRIAAQEALFSGGYHWCNLARHYCLDGTDLQRIACRRPRSRCSAASAFVVQAVSTLQQITSCVFPSRAWLHNADQLVVQDVHGSTQSAEGSA